MSKTLQRLSLLLCLTALSTPTQANLESNWREIFSPTKGWDLACGYKLPAGQAINTCRSRALINFETTTGKASDSDIIVHMFYDHRRLWVTIAPYVGECASGMISGDNGFRMAMRETRSGCVPDKGQALNSDGSKGNALNIPLNKFTENSQITVKITRKDGSILNKTINMSNFMQKFQEIQSSGTRHSR